MTEPKQNPETQDPNKITHQQAQGLGDEILEDEIQDEVQDQTQAETPAHEPASDLVPGISLEDFRALTKRNQQFMVSIANQMAEADFASSLQEAVNQEMTQTLLEGQESGQTARHLYGTPTEAFETIQAQELKAEEAVEVSPDWQLGIDGGLLLGSIYTFVTGLSALTRAETIGSQMGLVTMILNYLVAGYAMIYIAKNLPNPDAPKGEKGYGKYFLVTTLTMILWVAVIALSMAFLPPVLNPILPNQIYLAIGALTFLLRMYLKRKWNIQGGVF